MNLSEYKRVYFIGIGGIGMSALARYFLDNNLNVAGYDKTPSSITQALETEGAIIHFEDQIDLIPTEYSENVDDTLVVYTPAIPIAHKELNYFRKNKFVVKKRAEILGMISENKFTIAVAGTHGKTSTSWMIAHLLKSCGIEFYALLGGISSNYNTNYISPSNKDCKLLVVEADEYDRSFFHLKPNIAILTSIDPDHLDIYGQYAELIKAYQQFANSVSINGKLIKSESVGRIKAEAKTEAHIYGIGNDFDVNAINIRIAEGTYMFDILTRTSFLEEIKLHVAGHHNILNALAAFAAVWDFVQDDAKIRAGFESYKGVKRRFEYIIQKPNIVFVDDYAHHPSEIEFTINTLKELFPDKKITGIFQPHLYSRTRDFADEFSKVLANLDKIVLLDIYPAREEPIDGINSDLILSHINKKHKYLVSKDELLELIKEDTNEVVVTMGAGDIDRLIDPIKVVLLQR
ncbi:MAG: UDP-N-acetylmuramate--L-alanine ligase [Bacteroidetes bacterium]|nr:UDP-N-acetylmuramate--L-alanine ligase [Bacteroidota bacterium]